jgi:hypothetical protein
VIGLKAKKLASQWKPLAILLMMINSIFTIVFPLVLFTVVAVAVVVIVVVLVEALMIPVTMTAINTAPVISASILLIVVGFQSPRLAN